MYYITGYKEHVPQGAGFPTVSQMYPVPEDREWTPRDEFPPYHPPFPPPSLPPPPPPTAHTNVRSSWDPAPVTYDYNTNRLIATDSPRLADGPLNQRYHALASASHGRFVSTKATVENPPDGGLRAWLIVLACAVINACNGVVFYTFWTTMYPLADYDDNKEFKTLQAFLDTSLLGELLAAILAIAVGYRIVAVSGGVLVGVGFLVAAYLNPESNAAAFKFFVGFVAGLGSSFWRFTSRVAVLEYFRDKRRQAIILAGLGNIVGMFVGYGVFTNRQKTPYSANSLVHDWTAYYKFQLIPACIGALAGATITPLQQNRTADVLYRSERIIFDFRLALPVLKIKVFWLFLGIYLLYYEGQMLPESNIIQLSVPKFSEADNVYSIPFVLTCGALIGYGSLALIPRRKLVGTLLVMGLSSAATGIFVLQIPVFEDPYFGWVVLYLLAIGAARVIFESMLLDVLPRSFGRGRIRLVEGLLGLTAGIGMAVALTTGAATARGEKYDSGPVSYKSMYENKFYLAGAALLTAGLIALITYIILCRSYSYTDRDYEMKEEGKQSPLPPRRGNWKFERPEPLGARPGSNFPQFDINPLEPLGQSGWVNVGYDDDEDRIYRKEYERQWLHRSSGDSRPNMLMNEQGDTRLSSDAGSRQSRRAPSESNLAAMYKQTRKPGRNRATSHLRQTKDDRELLSESRQSVQESDSSLAARYRMTRKPDGGTATAMRTTSDDRQGRRESDASSLSIREYKPKKTDTEFYAQSAKKDKIKASGKGVSKRDKGDMRTSAVITEGKERVTRKRTYRHSQVTSKSYKAASRTGSESKSEDATRGQKRKIVQASRKQRPRENIDLQPRSVVTSNANYGRSTKEPLRRTQHKEQAPYRRTFQQEAAQEYGDRQHRSKNYPSESYEERKPPERSNVNPRKLAQSSPAVAQNISSTKRVERDFVYGNSRPKTKMYSQSQRYPDNDLPTTNRLRRSVGNGFQVLPSTGRFDKQRPFIVNDDSGTEAQTAYSAPISSRESQRRSWDREYEIYKNPTPDYSRTNTDVLV